MVIRSRPYGGVMRQVLVATLFTIVLVASMTGAATAQSAVPDLRGTWKGESETVILGGGNPHHPAGRPEPRYASVPFTMTIDKQDGRRFSGTFSSARSTETIIGVVSRSGTIHMVDDDGHNTGTLLAPNRMESLLSPPVAEVADRLLHGIHQAAIAGGGFPGRLRAVAVDGRAVGRGQEGTDQVARGIERQGVRAALAPHHFMMS